MAIKEIGAADIVNKGVKGLPDVPGLTTAEMQRKMDELATDVLIPKVNEVVKGVNELDANKLDKTGDSTDNTVTFSSGDSTSPTGWDDIVAVASGETHKSLFRKFSMAVKNLRYLYKMLGSTDISAIGDGTATGAIATINSDLETKIEVKQYSTEASIDFDSISLSIASKSGFEIWTCSNNGFDTSVPNGAFLVIQYSVDSGDYMAQIVLSYFGTFKHRTRKLGKWDDWISLV